MVDMANKYSVTFKAVAAQTPYIEDGVSGTSQGGHIWYVLSKNGKTNSFGFSQYNYDNSKGYVTRKDDDIYQGKPDKQITIQINQEQYDKLLAFGKQELGNVFNYDKYSPISNSCVSFVFKALNLIGYNPNDKKPWIAPSYDLDDIDNPINAGNLPGDIVVNGYHYLRLLTDGFEILTELLAKNGAIEVKDNNTLIPVSESRTNDIITRPYEITGYDDSNDTIIGSKGDDKLIGGSGDDKLIGGNGAYGLDDDYHGSITVPDDGKDILEGGEGHDIYYVGGEDTIIDSDGKGEIRFLDKNGQVVPEDENGFSSALVPKIGYIVSFTPGLAVFKADDFRFELGEETLTITQESTGHKAIIKNSGLSKFVKTGETGLSGISLNDIAHCYDGCEHVIKTYYDRGWIFQPPYMMGRNGTGAQGNGETKEGSETPENNTPENKAPENNTSENKTKESNVPTNTFVPKEKQSQTKLNLYSRNSQPIQNIQLPQAHSRFTQYRLEGNDLLLFGYNAADSLRLKGFYNSSNNLLQNFQFSDRTLSLEQMKTEGITLSGTVRDDIMHDWHKQANTTFSAGKGNDKIYAGDGDDTLIGGEGNDLLQGGNGKDTYVFEPGHGQDIITEFNTTQDDDTLQFNYINFDEVKFRRDNYDLTLFGYNEQDSVTIKAFFANKNNQLEYYQFADRTLSREALTEEMILVNNQVDRMVQAISGFGAQGVGGVLSSTQDDMKNQWQLAPSV
jgi:RTX toxin protein